MSVPGGFPMKQLLIGLCTVLVGAVVFAEVAEAKRLGGGRTTGPQRSVTAPPPAAAPSQSQAPQAAPAPQAAQQPGGIGRWLAPMLGGLAIGGLLGALFGGNGLGGLLLLAVLVIGGIMLFRAFARRGQSRSEPMSEPVQFAGMGRNESVRMPMAEASSGAAPAAKQNIPAGFDVSGFERGAKLNFIKLQAANDAGNLDELRELTTQEMFDELSRDVHPGNNTDVVSLNAQLLEVVTEGDKHWASVCFSGSIRESQGGPAEDF